MIIGLNINWHVSFYAFFKPDKTEAHDFHHTSNLDVVRINSKQKQLTAPDDKDEICSQLRFLADVEDTEFNWHGQKYLRMASLDSKLSALANTGGTGYVTLTLSYPSFVIRKITQEYFCGNWCFFAIYILQKRIYFSLAALNQHITHFS